MLDLTEAEFNVLKRKCRENLHRLCMKVNISMKDFDFDRISLECAEHIRNTYSKDQRILVKKEIKKYLMEWFDYKL